MQMGRGLQERQPHAQSLIHFHQCCNLPYTHAVAIGTRPNKSRRTKKKVDIVATLKERLEAGETIILDGGTGTEMERRGVPMQEGAWCGVGSIVNPDGVRGVHEAYINAGADVLIANTYASSRHVLAQADMAHEFEHANRLGIELARQACDNVATKPIAVAGSISTTAMYGDVPSDDVARVNYNDQAEIQAEGGADLIILEMMRDIDHTQIAIDAVKRTGLPLWIGYSCKMYNGEPWLFNMGHSFADGLKSLDTEGVDLIAIMHTETVEVDACLDVMDQHWDGPTGAYAQTGKFKPPHWHFIDTISPADYGDACKLWHDRGVQVIGGCCGIGPEHIEHLGSIL